MGNGALSWRQRQIVMRLTLKCRAADPSLPKTTLNKTSCRPPGKRRSKRDIVTGWKRDGIFELQRGCARARRENFPRSSLQSNSLKLPTFPRSILMASLKRGRSIIIRNYQIHDNDRCYHQSESVRSVRITQSTGKAYLEGLPRPLRSSNFHAAAGKCKK